jgi:peptide/nickel transport system permease protein/oligopeptide transport system permease protein
MGKYALTRLVSSIPVILGVTIAVFFMVRLVPGDPVNILFEGRRASDEDRAAVRRQLGLDDPLPVQFVNYLGDLARGDLGTSFRSKQPVWEEIWLRLPNTLKLTGASLLLTVVVGVPLGILAAVKKGTWLDLGSMFTAIIAVSVPGFWLGLILMMFFALRLGWFPISGADSWKHLVLPAFTLGIRSAAVLARLTRSAMLEVLNQDYVRTARAKGLADRVVIAGHALRNALIPIATVLGFELGAVLTGAFIVETVFAYPGMGMLAVQALANRDFPLIQGIVLVTALGYVLANLLVDLLYGVLDPRIRYS